MELNEQNKMHQNDLARIMYTHKSNKNLMINTFQYTENFRIKISHPKRNFLSTVKIPISCSSSMKPLQVLHMI